MRPLLLFDAAKRDPTGTSGIRAAFRTAGRQRLHLFASALNKAVTDEDRLGLTPGGVMAYHSPAIRQDAFASWLGAAGATIAASGWSRPFLAQAWNKGVLDASFDLGTPLSPQADSSYLEVLCDHEVRGVIAAVNQQISRAAELAISKRMKPGAAYRALKGVFDKVAEPRLHLIAHVLTVRAYNDAKLQAYHSAGVTHVGVVPEWMPPILYRARDSLTNDLQLIFTTQGDDRVCDECDEYADDSPYTVQAAIGIIPVHPNCRCTWTPFIETGRKHKKYVDALTADVGWTEEARAAALLARRAHGWPAGGHPEHLARVKEGSKVDGLTVLHDVPNTSSIDSSMDEHESLGLREVPFSLFEAAGNPVRNDRTKDLAAQIKASGEIAPLIVAFEERNKSAGPYIVEGGHRFDALQIIGKTSFPALVVVDTTGVETQDAGDYDETKHPRAEHGYWSTTGGGEASGHSPGKGYSEHAYVKGGVIHTNNVYDAQLALFQNRKVELRQIKQVSTLIQRLGETAAEMEEHGGAAPVFNLCNVSVKGTNLFCAESKGIPRVKMPVIPAKQTKAFVKWLKEDKGYKVEKDTERAANLRATQDEISGAKVAASMKRIREEGFYKRLVVSRDDYILDGHHTWAGQLGIDAKDNDLHDDKSVKISRVNISITKLIAAANEWNALRGITKKAVGQDALTDDDDPDFDESKHPRAYAGRWTAAPDDWKQIGPRRGSNPGGLHVNKKGEEWYVKTPPSADHIHSDVLANELYRLAGVAVPEEKLTSLKGKPALASRILPGARTLAQLKPAERANVEAQLRQHIAVDAWLANWDVVGLEDDNVLMTPDGKAYRVDQGGSLRYRAMGGLKPKFDFAVDEINTLRNPKMGPNAARVFGPMSKHDILGSIDKVLAVPDASIRMLAANHGQQKVGETLIKRKEWLASNRHAFMDAVYDAAYDPMLHPHAGTGKGGGQFIETGGGTGGAGKKTLWVASTNGEAHAYRVDKVLKMDVKRNNNYRWQVQQFIKEAKKLGGGHLNQIPALKLKIAESFVEHAKLLKKKGDAKGYVPGFTKKALELGYDYNKMQQELSGVKAPLAPPPKPEPKWEPIIHTTGKDPVDEDEPEVTELEPEDPSQAIFQAKILYKEGMKTAAMLKVQKAVDLGLKGPALSGALGPEMQQAWLKHNEIDIPPLPPPPPVLGKSQYVVTGNLPPTVAKIVEAWNVENYGKPADLAVLRSRVAKALGQASAAGGLSGKNWQEVYNEWAAANGFPVQQVEPPVSLSSKAGESITKGTVYDLPKSKDHPDWNKKIEEYNSKFADTPPSPEQKQALKEVLYYGYSQVPAGHYEEWAAAAGFDPKAHPDVVIPASQLPTPGKISKSTGGLPEEAFAESPEPTPEEAAASAAEFEKLKAIHEANKAALAKQPGEPELPTLEASTSEMAVFAGKVGLAASQVKAALKTTPAQVSFASGAEASPTVQKLIAVFNAKWANEPVTTVAELKSKVKDYETFKNNVFEAYQKEKAGLAAASEAKKAEYKAKQAEQQMAALNKLLPTDADKNNYKVLTGVVSPDYAKAYMEYSAAAIKKNNLNITPVEGAIIRAYTASFYQEINTALRMNATTQQVFDFTEALNTALDKLPAHVGITYRKTDLPDKVSALYKKGSVIYERAFTSSSTSEGVWSGDWRYVIHGTNGRDVKPISEHTSEKEVLYKSNSVFRVLKVEGHTIHLEQLK